MLPAFLDETRHVRDTHWRCAETPADLLDRRVEITGPVSRKMVINALNSGARVFMADFEDATSPTWTNVMDVRAPRQRRVTHSCRARSTSTTLCDAASNSPLATANSTASWPTPPFSWCAYSSVYFLITDVGAPTWTSHGREPLVD